MVEQNIQGKSRKERIHAVSGQRTKLFEHISSETYTSENFKDGQRFLTVHYEDTQTSNNIQLLPAKAFERVRQSRMQNLTMKVNGSVR